MRSTVARLSPWRTRTRRGTGSSGMVPRVLDRSETDPRITPIGTVQLDSLMSLYAAENFTAEEELILRRYVTNLDLPVFALVNLPEVVKGALFARYSRSAKSLRRLFLDEFVDGIGPAPEPVAVGTRRAEQLYERVLNEYGDDSVA